VICLRNSISCRANHRITAMLVAIIGTLLVSTFAILPDSLRTVQAAPDDFTFVAAGDFGCSNHQNSDGFEKSKEVLAKMAEHNPEVVLGLGHYSYQSSMLCWHDDLEDFPSLHSTMHNSAFRPIALGEHETGCDSSSSDSGDCEGHFNATGRTDFLNHFAIRDGSTFYSFDYKGVHFLALDTNVDFEVGSAQYNFTKADLEYASTDLLTKWIVVFFHHPMYRSECDSCGDNSANIAFRNVYQPLFDRNRVDLVLAGHVNAYERFMPLTHSSNNLSQTALIEQITDHGLSSYSDPRGQIHVTVGTGGRPVNPWSGFAPETANRVGQTYGFLKVEVKNSENRIAGSFIDKSASPGVVQDSFTVTHSNKFADAQYFEFNGGSEVSSKISVPSTPSLQLTQFTVAAWFQTNYDYGQVGNDKKRIIVNKGGFNGDGTGNDMNYGIWVDYGQNGGKIQAGFEAQNVAPALRETFVSSELKYNDGRWHHAVVSNDGSALRLFIDGVLATGTLATKDVTNKLPDNTGHQPLKIGYNSGMTSDLGSAFRGNIDEVRLWNRSLSSQEVWAAYTGNINTAGQVLYKPASRPAPNAGPDLTVAENAPVTLNGLASTDSDGSIFSYAWAQTGGPLVALSSHTSAMLTFTAPSVGTGGAVLTFALSVTDNEGHSSALADSVQIFVSDSPNPSPVASAGSDIFGHEGSVISLNGSASFDPEGQSLTYFWVQTFGPPVSLDNPTSAVAHFVVPELNNKPSPIGMAFLLTVSDGHQSSRDTITVTITDHLFPANGSQFRDIANDTETLSLDDSFTVTAWVRTTADTGSLDGKTPIVNKGGFGTDAENSNMNYGIWMDCGALEVNPDCRGGNRIEAGFESSNGTDVFVETPIDIAYNTGKWYFVAVTFDGYKLKLYVNAVQVDGRTTRLQPDSEGAGPVRLGANSLYESGGVYQPQYFTGDVDEVGIWNRALSREEVASMYVSREIDDAGMILYDTLN
jgi:hypothetical protein